MQASATTIGPLQPCSTTAHRSGCLRRPSRPCRRPVRRPVLAAAAAGGSGDGSGSDSARPPARSLLSQLGGGARSLWGSLREAQQDLAHMLVLEPAQAKQRVQPPVRDAPGGPPAKASAFQPAALPAEDSAPLAPDSGASGGVSKAGQNLMLTFREGSMELPASPLAAADPAASPQAAAAAAAEAPPAPTAAPAPAPAPALAPSNGVNSLLLSWEDAARVAAPSPAGGKGDWEPEAPPPPGARALPGRAKKLAGDMLFGALLAGVGVASAVGLHRYGAWRQQNPLGPTVTVGNAPAQPAAAAVERDAGGGSASRGWGLQRAREQRWREVAVGAAEEKDKAAAAEASTKQAQQEKKKQEQQQLLQQEQQKVLQQQREQQQQYSTEEEEEAEEERRVQSKAHADAPTQATPAAKQSGGEGEAAVTAAAAAQLSQGASSGSDASEPASLGAPARSQPQHKQEPQEQQEHGKEEEAKDEKRARAEEGQAVQAEAGPDTPGQQQAHEELVQLHAQATTEAEHAAEVAGKLPLRSPEGSAALERMRALQARRQQLYERLHAQQEQRWREAAQQSRQRGVVSEEGEDGEEAQRGWEIEQARLQEEQQAAAAAAAAEEQQRARDAAAAAALEEQQQQQAAAEQAAAERAAVEAEAQERERSLRWLRGEIEREDEEQVQQAVVALAPAPSPVSADVVDHRDRKSVV